jgi:hypothetical protein
MLEDDFLSRLVSHSSSLAVAEETALIVIEVPNEKCG